MPKTRFLAFAGLFIISIFVYFEVGFNASPIAIVRYLSAQVGSAVGVTVNIPPNPFNTLAQQLKEKESALSEKEKTLQEKEATLESEINKEKGSQNKTLMYLAAVGGILLVLILANFYFDYRRRRNSI